MTVTTGGPLPAGDGRGEQGAYGAYDVTVIGAGVVGSAIARELAGWCWSLAVIPD